MVPSNEYVLRWRGFSTGVLSSAVVLCCEWNKIVDVKPGSGKVQLLCRIADKCIIPCVDAQGNAMNVGLITKEGYEPPKG